MTAASTHEIPSVTPETQCLRLLSYNIQTGITTNRYRHYLTRGWRHVLPSAKRQSNLARIAALASTYDIVGLQEVDGGSLRSGYINQVEFLALKAGFPHWHSQVNRNLGRLAQHSNGILSRIQPTEISEHALPGRIPGRGAIMVRFGDTDPLILIILHLALSRRAQRIQMDYVGDLVRSYRYVIVMGDMNCRADADTTVPPFRGTDLHEPMPGLNTFPSWQPQRSIDRILVTPDIDVHYMHTLPCTYSDHLPLAVEVGLPLHIRLDGRATT